ncbi:hypothetical protein FKP32DRAFT_560045 [Trametes sanguinea]|nr:hypothetical protein FKP32DRAFT_560045 [Trametes sanguinea]
MAVAPRPDCLHLFVPLLLLFEHCTAPRILLLILLSTPAMPMYLFLSEGLLRDALCVYRSSISVVLCPASLRRSLYILQRVDTIPPTLLRAIQELVDASGTVACVHVLETQISTLDIACDQS